MRIEPAWRVTFHNRKLRDRLPARVADRSAKESSGANVHSGHSPKRPFMTLPVTSMADASTSVPGDAASIDVDEVRDALQPIHRNEPGSDAAGHDQRLLFRGSRRFQRLTGFEIRSIGSYVPSRVVTNEELEQRYGFEEGWVKRRTGILQRRFAAESESTSDLAVEAARRALTAAGLQASDVDLLIVGTFTPDFTCPSTACLVQDKLKLDAPAMDIQAACSGFMYALATGAQFVATGNSKCALVIGADINSRIVQPDDQRTAPLFGDGAGAVILEHASDAHGLICYQLGADGAGGVMLDRPVGGASSPLTPELVADGKHFLQMDGRNVFKWAIQAVTESILSVLEKAGVTTDDVALFVLHQANIRIIDHAMKVLNIPRSKVYNNLDRVGNTSAASIPLALDEAYREGRIGRGDLVLMCGFGAGLTWGTGLMRW